MIYVNVVLEGYQNERYMLTAQLIKGKSSHPSKNDRAVTFDELIFKFGK
jgi:hypothetical protein